MRVALYLRVSTDMQDTERQRRDIGAWCSAHGHILVATYQETASGAVLSRPERKCLMSEARKGVFDAIIVTELSRWSRSTVDLLETLQTLSADGVRLIALNGPDFDIGKPIGKLMLTVLGAISEFERSLIAERVRSGIATRKAKGLPIGGRKGNDWRVQEIRRKLPSIDPSLSLRAKAELLKCSVNTLRSAMSIQHV